MENGEKKTTKTISLVMLLTLIGKGLGLYRNRLLAIHYSIGTAANAFFTASRIPRVFFDAIFASAVSACFIPVYAQVRERQGEEKATVFAGNFISVIMAIMGVITLLGVAVPRPLVLLFSDYGPGETQELAILLTRILFPMMLFSGLAFSLVGVLQAHDHFFAPALMSAASNLVIILYFFTLNETGGVYGLSGFYLLGWAIQVALLLPSLRRMHFRYRPGFSLATPEIRQVFSLMGPVMVSTWVQPVSLMISSRYGSRLYGGGGVAALEYATDLYLVLAGVFVLSVTNVIFPRLSRQQAGGQQEDFRKTLSQTVHGSLFFLLPMGAGLMVVAAPLVEFLYGGGVFDARAAELTASALFWMAPGFAAYGLQNILSRAYFARREGRVPLLAGAGAIVVNLLGCQLLGVRFGVGGLAVASTLSVTVYALILLLPLKRHEMGIIDRAFLVDLGKMLLATLLTAAAARGMLALCGGLCGGGKAALLLVLALCALSGCLAYGLAVWLLRLPETAMLRRRKEN